LANTRDRAEDVAPNRGFSRSGNLLVSLEFTPDRPQLPWQRKLGILTGKWLKVG